ncbi:diguanylate cyclase domain-containing protein [Pelomonas sp. KK5]|uniref:sensor domain-containing diguanylate cyclase n=1 Tax=Pelomonas sp. KK5 TaxID=1855730 RepID=UPI0009F86DBC|nr:diguanylate cyclase [Pelomonas sp. KK5]
MADGKTTPAVTTSPSLRGWLVTTVLLSVVAAVLACALLIERFARAHAERTAIDSLSQISDDFRDALDRGMAQQFQEVRVFAQLEPFRRFDDPAAVRRALDEVHAGFPHFAWMGLTDRDGKVLASAGGLLEGVNVSKRPWWQGAHEGQGLFVGDVHGAVLLEKLLPRQAEPWRFVDFAVPIRDSSGQLQGVFGAHLSWTWARRIKDELIDAALQVHEVEALVLARDGTVLLGPPGAEGKPLPGLPSTLLSSAGTSQQLQVQGQEWFVVTAATRGLGDYPGMGWVVLLRKPVQAALADYYQLRLKIALAALGLVALFMPLAWWLARRLTLPLVALCNAVAGRSRLAAGQALPQVRGFREVELLSNALGELSERQAEQDALLEHRVAERTEALQQANERLAASEQRLDQLSRSDTLTGLSNRRQFDERLPQAMARSRRNGRLMALIYLDLDKFKAINDGLGHAAGDAVLQQFAQRLLACVRETDLVARLGGDEFVLVVENAAHQADIEHVADKILAAMQVPMMLADGRELPVGTSVGVAIYRNEAGVDARQLPARADTALYEAKAAGRGTYKVLATA